MPPLFSSRDDAKVIFWGWRRGCAKTTDVASPANPTSRTRPRSLALTLGQIRAPASLTRAIRQTPHAHRRRLSVWLARVRVNRERLLSRVSSPNNSPAPAEIHRESGAPAGRTDATGPAHTQHLAPAPHPAVLPKAARFVGPTGKKRGAEIHVKENFHSIQGWTTTAYVGTGFLQTRRFGECTSIFGVING